MPVASPTPKMIVAVMRKRPSAASTHPATTADRCGAARKRRRVKPLSKSRAIEKPVNTPPNAADWRKTKTNWNAV